MIYLILLCRILQAQKATFIIWIALPTILIYSCKPEGSTASENNIAIDGKVIMAVFAHPDDELFAAPILSKYSRVGAEVQLVIATDGRYGTGQTDLKPGEELVKLRIDEANCAASSIGINKPILLGYHDQLKLKEGYFGHVPYVQKLMGDLDSLMNILKPDVIITWGPDGGSNHMDHRIVGASISQVYLSKTWEKTRALFYIASPSSKINDPKDMMLRGVDDKYLTTRITYTDEDIENTITAMSCYKSQFSQEQMDDRAERMRDKDKISYLRPLVKGSSITSELF